MREVAVQVVHRVAPGDDVHAQAGALPEDRVEVIDGRGVLVLAAREAELVLAAAEVAEPRQVVDEDEDLGPVAARLLAAPDLVGRPRRGSARCRASRRPRRRAADNAAIRASSPVCGWSSGVPSSTKKRAPCRTRRIGGGRILGGQAQQDRRGRRPSAASSFWPTISRLFPPSRRKRAEVGSLIATASPSHAWTERGDGRPGRRPRAARAAGD